MSGCSYLGTGELTSGKREWLQRQVDALEAANRELCARIGSYEIQIKVNRREAQKLRDLLGGRA